MARPYGGSYFLEGTSEAEVYRHLVYGVDWFTGLVGSVQPILHLVGQAARTLTRKSHDMRTTGLETKNRRNRIRHRQGQRRHPHRRHATRHCANRLLPDLVRQLSKYSQEIRRFAPMRGTWIRADLTQTEPTGSVASNTTSPKRSAGPSLTHHDLSRYS